MLEVLTLEEARDRLLNSLGPISNQESLDVGGALGRILAEDITAPISLPPFENSAMDGYAVSTQDPVFSGPAPYRLKLVAKSYAGRPWTGTLTRGTVRIFTGAAVPRGADSIVLQEDVQLNDGEIEFTVKPAHMRHIRRAGSDVVAGDRLLVRGTRLRAFELGWLAACGIESVRVYARPRVGLFATGDELREPGSVLEFGQIYESNRLALHSLAQELPVEIRDLGILPDDKETLTRVLEEAASAHDALITSGGVSVGETDHVRDVVDALGTIDFWRVAIKPGKPFAVGRIGECLFMGLPGNPASAVVTFLLLAAPALTRLSGGAVRPPLEVEARLGETVVPPRGREEFQRGSCARDAQGLWVNPTGSQDSNRIGSFRDANCLIRLAPGTASLEPGTLVPVLPFDGLLKGGG